MEAFIPNFTLQTNPPTDDEKKLFGIFISHSNADNKYLDELAKKIGFNRVQITRYETGIHTPPIEYVIAFCKHYKVSADYILGLPKDGAWPRE